MGKARGVNNASRASGAVYISILRCGSSREWEQSSDQVAREEPLEIRVRGKSVAVTMRTPGRDRELAAGFLVTEGVIRGASDIVDIAPCGESADPDNVLNVFLLPRVQVDFDRLTRHVFASS